MTDRFSRIRDNVQGSLPWRSLPTGFKRKKRKPCASIKDHFSVTDRFSRLRDNVQGSLLWGSFPTAFKRNKRKPRGSIKEHFSVTDRVLRLLYLRRQLALLVVFVLKIDNGVVMTWTNVLLLCPFQSHLFPKTS